MDVDMSALKALERDKDISMEVLIDALTDALLNAYQKTPGAVEGARQRGHPARVGGAVPLAAAVARCPAGPDTVHHEPGDRVGDRAPGRAGGDPARHATQCGTERRTTALGEVGGE